MPAHRNWTRPEQLQVLRIDMRLPFGQLHQRHREIIALARRINRTPGAVAMKATNFASLDETITSTGRKGLTGASSSDRALWAEFVANPEAIAAEAEAAAESHLLLPAGEKAGVRGPRHLHSPLTPPTPRELSALGVSSRSFVPRC